LVTYAPTIAEAFFRTATACPAIGITLLAEKPDVPETFRSYRELTIEARRMAAALAAEGVRTGDRVMMVLPTSFEFVTTLFAIQLLRAIPVPVYPPATLEKLGVALAKLRHVAVHSGASLVVTDSKLQVILGELAAPQRPMVTVEALQRRSVHGIDVVATCADDAALIQYTSGSTGNPKGVRLSHWNLVSNIHASGQAVKVRAGDAVGSWLPLYHDMGLIGNLLFSIYWQLPLVLMSPTAFLMRPIRWLRAISDHRVSIVASPNFGYERCVARVSEDEMEGLDLSSLRIALNGAEAVNHKTIAAFAQKFASVGYDPNAMFPSYGLAEATVAVAFSEPGAPTRFDRVDRVELANGRARPSSEHDAVVFTGCGTAVPAHAIAIVDDDGNVLPDRSTGNVVVTGPSVMTEYYRDPDHTARAVRDGVLWTGDLGYLVEGTLFITGRVKDLILVRGKKYYAEDIEAAAETVEGVRQGCTVAFGIYNEDSACDQLVMVCETRVEGDEQRCALQRAVATQVQEVIGLAVREVVLVEPGTLPKTSSGKRQRWRRAIVTRPTICARTTRRASSS
jgi:acyl-CoA synthetase (AMP-forming)/AMP-acid ligase II